MIATVLITADGKSPDPEPANRSKIKALWRNLILMTCGDNGNMVRFLAPITNSEEMWAERPNILEEQNEAAKKV